MTVQEYLSRVFTFSDASAIVGAVAVIFVAICALGGFFDGWRRGLFRQILHTLSVAAAFAASFLITKGMISSIEAELANLSPEELAAQLLANGTVDENTAGIIANLESEVISSTISLITTTLIAVLMFVVCYLVASIITKIVYFIVSRFIPKHRALATRVPSMLLGLVEGLVAASLVLTPMVAAVDISADLTATLNEEGEGDGELAVWLDTYVNPHAASPVVAVARIAGADDIATSFATVVTEDGEKDLRKELSTGITLFSDISKLGGMDWQKLDYTDKQNISALLSDVGDSDYFSTLVAGLLHTVALSIEEGYVEVEADETFRDFFTELLSVFITSNKDTLDGDLETFKKLYFLLSDEDVLLAISDSEEALTNALIKTDASGETVIARAITILKEGGDRTKPIITTLTKLSVTVMAENMGLGEDAAQLYDTVKDNLNSVLAEMPKESDYETPGAYKAAVSDEITKAFADSDIALDTELADGIADYYIESGLDEYEELSDDDINDLILSYYDAYLESQEVPDPS